MFNPTLYLKILKPFLDEFQIELFFENNSFIIQKNKVELQFYIISENFNFENEANMLCIPEDYVLRSPQKIVSFFLSQLKLNKIIFARNCESKKINKTITETFLNTYHLMNATQSGFNRGLFYKNELIAVASFSKGRKMNRLASQLRSFELIRFCCVSGITITGGLSKLLKNFMIEKNAGDIMTYVDKQLSLSNSFLKAGFIKHSDLAPNHFLINKTTFERTLLKSIHETVNETQFYKTQNKGSIKLILTNTKLVEINT